MKREVRDNWVKALRSGEYEQGEMNLKDRGKYCCLGVLGEINGVDLDTPADGRYAAIEPFHAPYDWMKFASMNDCGLYDFNQIADYIETLEVED